MTWKVVEAIIDNRVKAVVEYHDLMHGFISQHGTSAATLEAKLTQELACVLQVALFQVFLDLRKAYDTLDRPRALEVMAAYGMGPQMLRLIDGYWRRQKIVTRESGYYGTPFTATRSSVQGGLFSPNLFNMQIDNVIRHWLTLVIEDPTVGSDGLGLTVAERLVLFYADDGLLSARESGWLQQALDVLVSLFWRIGLSANADKTKTMTCFPGHICTGLSEEAHTRMMTGEGDSYKTRQQ